MSVASFFGFGKAAVASNNTWQRRMTHAVNLTSYKGRKQQNWMAVMAILKANGTYGYDQSDWSDLLKSIDAKESVEVDLPAYFLEGAFSWALCYRHQTKDIPDIAWPAWLELPNREREDYIPVVSYRVTTDDGEDVIINKEHDDPEWTNAFAGAFYALASLLMGVKTDPSDKQYVKTVPQPTGNQLPDFTIGNDQWHISFGYHLDANLEALSDDEIIKLLEAAKQVSMRLEEFRHAISNGSLSGKPQPVASKRTQLDYIKQAAEELEVAKEVRTGYAKDIADMIDENVAAGKSIKLILLSLESTGNHDAVLARAKEIAAAEASSRQEISGDGSSGSDNSNAHQQTQGAPKPSNLAKAYQKTQEQHGDAALKYTPAGWAVHVMMRYPEYSEDRKPGHPLAELSHREYSIFELALEYLAHTDNGKLPKYLTNLCDAEVRRLSADADE